MALDNNKKLATVEQVLEVAQKVKGVSGEVNAVKLAVNALESAGYLVATELETKVLAILTKEKYQTEEEVEALVAGKLAAYQTKEDTTAEIKAEVAKADHLKRKQVTSTGAINLEADDAEQYIYMVAKEGEEVDSYDEYMVFNGKLEKVGNWSVDLSDYVQTSALETKLSEYAKTEDLEDWALQEDLNSLQAEVTTLTEKGATKVEKSNTNGNIKIDGQEVTVYTLPNNVVVDSQITGMLTTGDIASLEEVQAELEQIFGAVED